MTNYLNNITVISDSENQFYINIRYQESKYIDIVNIEENYNEILWCAESREQMLSKQMYYWVAKTL
jgi:hypothetical protein